MKAKHYINIKDLERFVCNIPALKKLFPKNRIPITKASVDKILKAFDRCDVYSICCEILMDKKFLKYKDTNEFPCCDGDEKYWNDWLEKTLEKLREIYK